jgi:hypothetical protein
MLARIEVGEEPGPDDAIKSNNAKLVDLPKPFKASFDPGPRKEGDGLLEWETIVAFGPIQCEDHGKDDKDPCPAAFMKAISRKPGSIPLEVGTTKPSRTLLHLLEPPFGVARWPYNSKDIHVLVRTPKSINALYGA